MSHDEWPPLIKLLLAINEREPCSGNSLIDCITKQYAMSTHTYVKARKIGISNGYINVIRAGSKNAKYYSLTNKGKIHLNKLKDTIKNEIKGYFHTKYKFKFSENELGNIDFSIKTNKQNPFFYTSFEKQLESLIFTLLDTQYLSLRDPEFKDKVDIDTEINIKISAKQVDLNFFDMMHYLFMLEKEYEKNLSKPSIIKGIEKEAEKIILSFPDYYNYLKWHLCNVSGLNFEVFLVFEEGRPIGCWLPMIDWSRLKMSSLIPEVTMSVPYWGTFIFQEKEEALRWLRFSMLYSCIRFSEYNYLYNVFEINLDVLNEELDDYTFLEIWEKARVGFIKKTKEEDSIFMLIDDFIFKKWVLLGKPQIKKTFDIKNLVYVIYDKSYEVELDKLNEIVKDYIKQTRFDIIEKSQA